jgi:hypothetical protein
LQENDIAMIHYITWIALQVVDFCCGANDFSTQAYQELSKFGKNCEFMNFDIHQPKVVFSIVPWNCISLFL